MRTKYFLFIYYVYSMSNENKFYNLKNLYIVHFNLYFNFLKISSYKVYFPVLYYFLFKNSILIRLKYN